jgi:cation diffusion facilitator family transporter
MKKINFSSPYVCMSLVIIMYIIKVIIKLSIGSNINSLAIYSDGLHNLADAFEAGLIIFAIYLSKQKESNKYPLGKSSIESLGSFLIGLVILYLALGFLLKSALGLFIYFNKFPVLIELLKKFVEVPPRIDLGTSPVIVIGLLCFSIALAWFFSWYEISTGKRKRHPSLIADGKETLADSFVELAVLMGVIGALFGLFYLDYIFGIVVSLVMLKTSRDVLSESLGNLLQKSIEIQKLSEIKRILNETKGIEDFEKKDKDRLIAYKLGRFVFISIKVYVQPSLSSEGFYYLRKGLSERIKELFKDSEVRVYIKESILKEIPNRAVIPVKNISSKKLNSFIEEDFIKSKSFFIVDLKGERIISVKQKDIIFNNYDEIKDFLRIKRIDTVYYVKKDKKLEDMNPNIKFKKTNFLIFKDLFH